MYYVYQNFLFTSHSFTTLNFSKYLQKSSLVPQICFRFSLFKYKSQNFLERILVNMHLNLRCLCVQILWTDVRYIWFDCLDLWTSSVCVLIHLYMLLSTDWGLLDISLCYWDAWISMWNWTERKHSNEPLLV